jgi:hypothetical protein
MLGIVYVLADLLLEWRGPMYVPWVGEGVMMNVVQMLTGITIFTGVALILGYAKDRRAIRGR